MANKKQGKVYNICVIGLSGYDMKEKRIFGVGKSCFCNRFVRPKQDEYYPDHASVYSTSDFVGSVLNNDHFLYWGKVEKAFDENTVVAFRVIEQTEFIDDASYTPLSKGGELAPYVKRATNTKLVSPGKIMYISRDQVALQYDYDQIQMESDGRITVDGFICIYDVSESVADNLDIATKQEEILSMLMAGIHKTKKPVVVVATKCDESNEQTLQKAHHFVHSKKISTPLVESSAESSVNIELGFQALFQLIDSKSRFRAKLISFQEGLLLRNEFLNKLNEKYLTLVKSTATNSSLLMSWPDFKKQHSQTVAFQEYTYECGLHQARLIFNQQAKKIKRHYEDRKLNEYQNKLPEALDELLPSLQAIEANEWKWENCQQAIKNHILFDKWFQILQDGDGWNTAERLFSTVDSRIPFDVLQVERSRACFDRHIKKLRESARKTRMKSEFRKLLELTADIQPGTNWLDAVPLVACEESYRYLDEHERKVLFETYLRDITLKAKLDFQELLFESANKFSKLSKDASPSAMEMKEIYDYLQNDIRHKQLENVGNARDILLFNHIALMQSPTRCLSGPDKCMDRLMQRVVEMTARTNVYNPYQNEIYRENEDELINLLIIGKDGLGEQLEDRIKIDSSSFDECVEVIVDGQIYGLNIKVFESEEENHQEKLIQLITEFKPQGYLAIYSHQDSFQYVDSCLQKIQQYENLQKISLPLIVLLANDSGREGEIQSLRYHGQNLANRMDCVFVDYPYAVSLMDDTIHDSQVHDAMRGIIDVINRRARPPSTPTACVEETADIRILLCAMCGDEYPVELILSTMLQNQVCYSNPEKQDTIMLEAVLGGSRKTISVTLGSYHRAYDFKKQMFHGYVLIYSATRLASLETLRAFTSTLHHDVPVQVLAVTGSASGSSIIFHEENAMLLLNDGSNLASKLHAKLTQSIQNQAGQFLTFFNNVHDRKTDTELILQGIKRRRQEPLPDVPGPMPPDILIPNGSITPDQNYAAIGPSSAIPPDSPYVEVALRHSYIMHHIDTDSSPSSPDRQRNLLTGRPRSSTIDSMDEVEHDTTGLYAKVNKKQLYTYIKKMEKRFTDDEDDDDDDDLEWQDNLAYDSSVNVDPHRVSVASNLNLQDSPKLIDRPYATVPFLPKGHKSMAHDYQKFATLPVVTSQKIGWSEPTYASIDQIKAQITAGHDQGYEADSMSSVSSRSKESTGSQLDIRESKSQKIKTPLISPATGANLRQLWSGKPDDERKTIAPIAKPDDDENDDLKELRKKLEDTLTTRKMPAEKKQKSPRKSKDHDKNSGKKQRSESNISTSSLDPRNNSFIKKIMNKVSPNPSPGNSDVEGESVEVPSETPTKKRRHRSFKKNKSSKLNTPSVVVNDADSTPKDRSNTLPSVDSPKQTPRFSSLDNRKHPKSLFKKHNSELPDINLQLPNSEPGGYQSLTLDRKKSKKFKFDKSSKVTKDDLFLNFSGGNNEGGTIERKKDKKIKSISVKFPNARRPRGTRNKRNEPDVSKQISDWQKITDKNQKFKNSNYFGKDMKDICPPDSLCPIFIKNVIEHVEAYGMTSEGIYRVSGNKHDVEAIMEKFEKNNNISLQELGVTVHAVTGALKQFFKMLPEPLIPYSFGSRINDIMIIMDAAERLNKLQTLVGELPQPNHEVFRLFMCHLNSVTKHKNKMDVRNLQTVLYPTLLRPNFDSLQNMTQNMNMGLFIQTCIEQSATIFEGGDEAMIIQNDKDTSTPPHHEETMDDKQLKLKAAVDTDSGTNCDDNDGVENQPTSVELSFAESVLTDPGVENIINLPSKMEMRLSTKTDSKEKNRRSFETAIY